MEPNLIFLKECTTVKEKERKKRPGLTTKPEPKVSGTTSG